MNDISETQRLADAVAALAMTLVKKLRAASEPREEQPAGRPPHGEYPNRYVPIPPNGKHCEFTGLKHAKLYDLLGAGGLARGKVRVANVRTPGRSRGQTLFHVGDMLRFLDDLASRQASETEGADHGT